MELGLKTNKDFIDGFIQGQHKELLKINKALELIRENLDMWCEDVILKELLENIESILK